MEFKARRHTEEDGFHSKRARAAMYRRSHSDDILLVGVYVDDLVITGSSLTAVEEFKEEMKRAFLMGNLGSLSFYLGIEVRQDAGGITLRQAHYAKILEMAGMADCKAAATAMEERLRLSRDSTAEEVDAPLYRRTLGVCGTSSTPGQTWRTLSGT
jgi:hypothetical protein